MPTLSFWYDLASTYAYISAMRIERQAAGAGVEIAWKPFLLGPIFKAQGWETSPFNLYPAKGRYMFTDVQRLAAREGLTFVLQPGDEGFPQNTVYANRIALIAAQEGWAPAFTKAAFTAQFADRANLADPAVLGALVTGAGQDASRVAALAAAQDTKDALRAQTEAAAQTGIFGAPTFITQDGALYWGDDRLAMALEASTS